MTVLKHDDNGFLATYVDAAGHPVNPQLTAGGKIPVDATFSGEIGSVNILDVANNEINPAKEDGNLATLAAVDYATQTTLAALNTKVTACDTGAVVVASGAITETNSGTIAGDTTSIDGKITACDTGAVVVASGAITETNSAAILSALDAPAQAGEAASATASLALEAGGNLATLAGKDYSTETTLAALSAKVTACDTGSIAGTVTANLGTIADVATETTLAALSAKVTAVDTGAVVVASGAITETNSGTIAGDTTSIDGKITACDTGAVVVASGAITETNSGTIAGDTTSIDGKIIACDTGAVVVATMPAVKPDRTVVVVSATGAAAISATTAEAKKFRLVNVTCHLSVAPATSEAFTVALNASDGADYDVTLFTVNPNTTDICWIPQVDLLMEANDEIVVTYPNTDTRTYGLRIVVEEV